MGDAAKILVVDDEPSVRETLGILLEEEGYSTEFAESAESALAFVSEHPVDLILTDVRMDEMSGVDLLRAAKQHDDAVEVIVMTAYGSTEDAVEAMKLGAYDYLTKPFNLDELRVLVRRALEKRALGTENERLREQLRSHLAAGQMVVASAAMNRLLELVQRVAKVDATVLITGESGVGKEIVARSIHELGSRCERPFVAVNCGALPENLVEAELFGHEKGAFTGADRAKPGLVEQADGGTLFLDEIGELPMAAQVKLLRVVQELLVRRLGGQRERKLDVRFVAATNRDLEAQVQAGTFREDLFYRLNVFRIDVPPLRERRDDIPVLAREFCLQSCQRIGIEPLEIEPDVLDALMTYDFPGNVRELQNVVERAVILSSGGRLSLQDLPSEFNPGSVNRGGGDLPEPSDGFDVEAYMASIERALFIAALDKANGVRNRAAELLGLSFRQFRYKASKFGI